MPRKTRKLNHKGKVTGRASSLDRAAKDEKARYERRRRRRKGLLKKANEFSTLFGDEVHLLIKNSNKTVYFTTEAEWTCAPHNIPGAIRVFAPGHVDDRQHQNPTISETSSDSDCEALDVSAMHDVHTGFVTRLEELHTVFKQVAGIFEDLVAEPRNQ